MTPEERNLIASLFDRLTPAAAQPRDRDAEALIAARVAAVPAAPYLLSQMALVHEHALRGAQNRIAELEQQVADAQAGGERPSSFLGGLLAGTAWARKEPAGDEPQPARRAGSVPGVGGRGITLPSQPMLAGGAMAAGSVPVAGSAQYARGPSFLQSALTTAAGVAGGMVLGNMLVNMLSHNAGSPVAAAAGANPAPASAPPSDMAAAPSPWDTAAAEPEPAASEQFDTAQDDGFNTDTNNGTFDNDFGGGGGGDSDMA